MGFEFKGVCSQGSKSSACRNLSESKPCLGMTQREVQESRGIYFPIDRGERKDRGALKPSFQKHVCELVHNHNPAILVVMETRIVGERAKEITNRLPFDGVVHTETIGYAGGLWMLWNSKRVEVTPLSNTDPKTARRLILWNNLSKVSELHNMPWVLAGDFNEPLMGEDKFGGRAELLKDLDVVLNQEEEIWALKSRVNWMVQGDRNIAFYHVSTLVRRKRNRIMAIRNAVGEWIYEENAIKEFIRSGFNWVYTSSFSCVS
ncbi:uncharacterized protein LOC142606522 [Castanea sativa]|uniref:uncharacterized protein LOC142606522 n=1 Tax=Castanea sativa TaxID=21020 RepID=UPI003F651026